MFLILYLIWMRNFENNVLSVYYRIFYQSEFIIQYALRFFTFTVFLQEQFHEKRLEFSQLFIRIR